MIGGILMVPILELHDVDVKQFVSIIESCKDNVYLITRDGDHLNLKSKLCQILGLTQLIEGGKIASAYVVCENPEDERKLFRFNLLGEVEETK